VEAGPVDNHAVEGWRDRLAGRLTRRTSSGRYIAEIDGLRFVAIAMVVLFHSQLRLFEASGGEIGGSPSPHNVFDLFIAQGRYGVHLFFIISGFILALPFAAERLAGARPVRLKAFYLRRLTRLEPPYFLVLTLYFLLGSTTHLWKLWSDYHDTLLPRFGAGLIYAHRFLFRGEPNPILPPTWSLEIEVQFYLLVPLLALVFTIQRTAKRRALMIGGAVFAAIFQWFMFETVGVLPPVLLSYLQFFLVGFLLADVFLLEWHQQPSQGWTWDAIGLAALLMVFVGPPPLDERILLAHQLVLLPCLFACVFCAAFRGPRLRSLLTFRWIAIIGGMCYSIYLLHTPLMAMLAPYTAGIGGGWGTVNVMVQFLVLGGISLLVSTIFFAFVERPCMDPLWPHRFATWAAERSRTMSRGLGAHVSRSDPRPTDQGPRSRLRRRPFAGSGQLHAAGPRRSASSARLQRGALEGSDPAGVHVVTEGHEGRSNKSA
jgi:peptidoglycan/LPS O-acetylase OafA/YrhL